MRLPGLILISICYALPLANVSADPRPGAGGADAKFLATYPDRRYALHRRDHLPRFAHTYPRHAPWYYAPPRDQRPRAQHQPYFNLHGYSSPTWRTPRTLRFHHHHR